MKAPSCLLASLVLVFCGRARSTPCDDPGYVRIGTSDARTITAADSATYAMKDKLCGAYIDSVKRSDAINHRVEIRTKKDPTNAYVGIGIGSLLLLGGTVVYRAGQPETAACKEDDTGILDCHAHELIAAPIFGLGLLVTGLSIYSLVKDPAAPMPGF